MKKGFTLIEMLAIIVVLIGVFSVVVPQINNSTKQRQEEEFKELSRTIENAAKLYVTENYEVVENDVPEYVTLKTLVINEYVPAPVKNPRTQEDFNDLALISIYQDVDDVYIYEFDNDNLLPDVTKTTIESNNLLNNKYAGNGHLVTLNIRFNKTIIGDPTVTIGGRPATVTGSGKERTATYLIPTGESTLTEGALQISITNYKDNNEVEGEPVTKITTGGNVIYDRTPPAFNSFYIGGEGNPQYVINRNTILHTSQTGASQMCISTTTSCSNWEPFSSAKAYTLSSGDGTKTLYIWLRDNAGNQTSRYSDSVILSTIPPTITYFHIGGTDNPSSINNGNTTLNMLVPSATHMCISTTTSCSNWEPYVESKSYTVSTGDGIKSANAWFRNVAGNVTEMVTDTILLDTTPPTCLSSGGSTTWTNSNRIITGTCSDSGSGCVGNITKTYSTNTNTTTASPGSVCDNAGNCVTCPANRTVRIDKTAPKCSSSGGNTTWVTSRTITGTCSDTGGSGCVGNITKTYSTTTNTTTASPGIVYDKAGNSVTCPSNQTVKVDKTAPTCTSSGGNATWTNGNRTITGTCSDSGSGCAGNATKTYSSNISSTTQTPGKVCDNLGNCAMCPSNQTVRIDKTAPTCTSGGGSTSWTNGSRTITGVCTDSGGSGCAGNATKTYSSNTNTTTASPGTVYDKAGNSAVCASNQTVRIDKTAPTCSSSGGNATWTNGNRTLTGTCSDTGGSGCAGNATKTYSSNTNTTTASPGTVYDKAGNSRACPSNQTVKVDKTAPTCSSSGGNDAWTNGNRTLTGTCRDTGGSGCKGNVSKSYTTNTNTTASPGTVYDYAGNSVACPTNQIVRIDKTAPTCSSSGGNAAWTNGNRTITGTCSDTGGSGCKGNATKTYSSNTNTTTASPGTVYDKAGNPVACPSNQTVKVDKSPPAISVTTPSSAWRNTNQTVYYTYSDSGGSGVHSILYRDCSSCTVYTKGSLSSPIVFSGERNRTTMQLGIRDHAGNVTWSSYFTSRIDKTKPYLGSPSCWSRVNAMPKIINVNTGASDALSGISYVCVQPGVTACSSSGSGSTNTSYTYTGSVVPSRVTFYYRSATDRAGNVQGTSTNYSCRVAFNY